MTHTRAAVAAALLVSLCGCGQPVGEVGESSTDAPRLVSLAPHLTELSFTAGAGDRLVGVVEYSDYPEKARSVARIGDAFRVDMEALTRLRPDYVLGWEGGNPAALLDELEARGFHVERLATGSLENIADILRRIGTIAGSEAQAARAADTFLAELSALRARYRDAARLRVFFQIGGQPVYTVNGRHAIGQIIDLCGGDNVFADLSELAPVVSDEAVVAAQPEVMLAVGDAGQLQRWRRFDSLAAVAGDQLYGVTGDLIARDSTRLLDGAREVCAHLQAARDAAAL